MPFIILGATVGVLGGTAGGYGDLIARIAGALLIAVGLYMAGVFKLPVLRTVLGPLTNWLDGIYFRERRIHIGGEDAPPSYWRSTIVGGAFGVGWTPCITPLLGAILTLAFNEAGNSLNAWSAAGQATILLGLLHRRPQHPVPHHWCGTGPDHAYLQEGEPLPPRDHRRQRHPDGAHRASSSSSTS